LPEKNNTQLTFTLSNITLFTILEEKTITENWIGREVQVYWQFPEKEKGYKNGIIKSMMLFGKVANQ
jgi:hypothetical protein